MRGNRINRNTHVLTLLMKGVYIMNATKLSQKSADYDRVEAAISFIEASFPARPGLREIAAQVGLSEHHFQRLFSRWVGISPKRFLQYLTKEHAKKLLETRSNLLDVAYDSGLSSPGRLHDLFVTCEAVTPGEYKSRGRGISIRYGFHTSPFGQCLLARTERGLCGLYFIKDGDRQTIFSQFLSSWRNANLVEDPKIARQLAIQVFDNTPNRTSAPLHLLLNGTNFQIKVWEALIRIPLGSVVAYEDLAAWVGRPKAARAVGSAVGKNPISFVIPCHRVIRKTAEFGNYGGGTARKKAILGWEAARAAA